MTLSLGDLVDRLSIVNLKLWFTQDRIYQYQRMCPDEFATQTDVKDKLDALAALNLQRNEIMTAIDETLAAAIAGNGVRVDPRVKITRSR